MSFQGQNPAKQHGDILMYGTHARFLIRNSVIISNTTSERVKIGSASTLNKTVSGLLTNGESFSFLPLVVFLVPFEVRVLSGPVFMDLNRDVLRQMSSSDMI